MDNSKFPLLNKREQLALKDALHYMKMDELKKASQTLGLSDKGKKGYLINSILTFIKSGKIIEPPKMPDISRAKNHAIQPLANVSLMLYGGYKNDLKTRNFFKQIIGSQFHFTAFGIDWLNERWLKGNPPTYQEFADFWIQETARRKQEGTKPKDEWMFIRFMQEMEKEASHASKEDLLHAWKQLQAQKRNEGFHLLEKASKVLK
jgi:hypothetical protein